MAEPRIPEELAALRERLVAYLDCELDAADRRRVEQLLADDEQARAELHKLDRTWALLDDLPRADLDAQFTRSTVEMAAVSAVEEIEHSQTSHLWSPWIMLGVVATALAGFAAGAVFWTRPNRQLVADLHLLEHLEAYRRTPNLDFLRELHERRLFVDDEQVAARPIAKPQQETLSERRRRVEGMSPEQKELLLRKLVAFQELSAAERHRLRALDAEFDRAPDADSLRPTLNRFQAWLEQLPDGERGHLLSFEDPRQRSQQIARIRKQQARRLGPDDARAFVAWIENLVRRNLDEAEWAVIDRQKDRARYVAIQEQLNKLMKREGRRGQPSRQLSPIWNDDDLTELAARLLSSARNQLEQAKGRAEQPQLLNDWVMQTFFPQQGGAHQLWLPDRDIDQAQLDHFFQAELNDAQRETLLALPPESMSRQLREMYLGRKDEGD